MMWRQSRGTSSSVTWTISRSGAKSPSMLYRLSRATKTVARPAAIDGRALRTRRSDSRNDSTELCLKGYKASLARHSAMPSSVEACTSSSYRIASPACGMDLQNATFASYPELQRRAAGAPKKSLIRDSKATWAETFPFSTREPPLPRIRSASESFSNAAARRVGSRVRER